MGAAKILFAVAFALLASQLTRQQIQYWIQAVYHLFHDSLA